MTTTYATPEDIQELLGVKNAITGSLKQLAPSPLMTLNALLHLAAVAAVLNETPLEMILAVVKDQYEVAQAFVQAESIAKNGHGH